MQRADKSGDFYVLDCPDWVLCVPVTRDGRILLVRQFRYGTEDFGWEVPGGVLDQGEDPVAGAERELEEETGYRAARCTLIGSSHPNPAIQKNRCHFFLAHDVELSGQQNWDEHEQLEIGIFDRNAVDEMIGNGAIHHALCLNALLYYGRVADGWSASGS